MSIDKDKIKHISKLARISVEEKKIDGLAKDLSSIFKFIEQLNELNTDKVEPLSSILNTPLRLRKDEVNDGKIRDKILKYMNKRGIRSRPVWQLLHTIKVFTKYPHMEIKKAKILEKTIINLPSSPHINIDEKR